MAEDFNPNITWTKRLEMYFSDMGEKAACLSWAHKRSEELYAVRRTYIDLPVIVLSSVTGFLSVGTGTIFAGYETYASVGLGVISLFVGVLNTTGSYFGWSKRAESHKISSLHYNRLSRFLAIEMALPRDERMSPTDLVKYVRENYERLAESSHTIPVEIVRAFRAKFGKHKDITFPEELNGIDPITVYNEYDIDRLPVDGMPFASGHVNKESEFRKMLAAKGLFQPDEVDTRQVARINDETSSVASSSTQNQTSTPLQVTSPGATAPSTDSSDASIA